ncbi:MAG: hypothetical protein II653_00640 [Lachnospiraceae bacterium]|nr:hypothetical protein [Lachnospiraceae bacterium]
MDKVKKVLGFLKDTAKILLVLGIFGGIGVFLQFGVRGSSARSFADEYFSYYATNNYEEMFKMVEFEEDGLVDKEAFITKCGSEKIYGSMNNYKFSKPAKDGNYITYVVTYYTGKEKTQNSYTITLHKQRKKYLLFFPVWKVSIKNDYVYDYSIDVPAGTTVTMDNRDVTRYKKSTSKDGLYDNYIIDVLLKGDHTISVVQNETNEFTKTEYVNEDHQLTKVSSEDFNLMPDEKSKIYEYSTFIVKTVYEYAMDKRRDVNDMKILFANTDAAQASAESVYTSMLAAIEKEDGSALSVINIDKLTPTIKSYTYPDRVTVNVNYTYDFIATAGTSLLNGLVSNYNGSGSADAVVVLNYIDGAWRIVKVNMNCIDYSQPAPQ